MKKLPKILVLLFLSLFLFLFLPQSALAQWGCEDPDTGVVTIKCFEVVFKKILNYAVELAVAVLFIMLIIGGFRYITSGGDPKATASAGQTITYAILGLVLLIGIWLILNFIQYFTGINITIFRIGG
jgi:hypothetical protein